MDEASKVGSSPFVLDIVTGTRDRRADFFRMLDSVIAHTKDVPWRMFIADASDVPYVADAVPTANCIALRESPRLGHVKGYNRLFNMCTSHWVTWLNDDVEVQPGWASQNIRFMEKNRDIGIGAIPFDEDGRRHVQTYHGIQYGSFGFLRRSLGVACGWFDDYLSFYGGDTSLCFKAFLSGKGVAETDSVAHLHHRTHDAARKGNEGQQDGDIEKMLAKYQHWLPFLREESQRHNMAVRR